MIKNYLVTLSRPEPKREKRSYYVYASSTERAEEIVLDFEPSYRKEWGLEVREV